MVLKMRFSLKGFSVILYLVSFCLPVFVNENIPGFFAFVFGFIYMFAEPTCFVWLANLTYFIIIFRGTLNRRKKIWFASISVSLAALFPLLFWSYTFTDGLRGGSYGIGYWFWFAAFVFALIDAIKEKDSTALAP